MTQGGANKVIRALHGDAVIYPYPGVDDAGNQQDISGFNLLTSLPVSAVRHLLAKAGVLWNAEEQPTDGPALMIISAETVPAEHGQMTELCVHDKNAPPN